MATSNVNQYVDKTPEQITQSVKIETSPYDKSISYQGPILSERYASYLLRAAKMKESGNILFFQVYVSAQYGNNLRPANSGKSWIFYNSVATDGGENYAITKIASDVDCSRGNCFFTEDFAFNVPEEILISRLNSGLSFRVSNVNGTGSMVLYIPAVYIKGFLAAVKSS
ncbi:MAG: hypothetical protein AB7H77_05000 [Bdellovibrionales bacterium]